MLAHIGIPRYFALFSACLVIMWSCLWLTTTQIQAQIPEDAQEIYVETSYKRYLRTVLVCQFHHDSVYVPLRDVFVKLNLDIQLDIGSATAQGFFIRTDSAFTFTFKRNNVTYANRLYTLKKEDYLIGAIDVWILPSVLERVFGLKVDVDINNLAANISCSLPLPAEEQYERKMRRKQAELARQRETDAEGKAFARKGAFFDRTRHVLNGGFLTYSLSSSFSKSASAHSYSLNAQAELFGGDLSAAALGTIVPNATSTFTPSFRWDYALKQNAWLTHIRLGTLPGIGTRQGTLLGVQLSNEPLRPMSDLGKFSYQGLALPNWEVEAFLNSQFLGVVFADSVGRYSFDVPLQYGSGLLQIKMYSPKGEIREETHRIQVPTAFAPPGELRYILTGGVVLNDTCFGMSLRTGYGIASWLSAQANIELDPFSNRWTATGALALRLGTGYIALLEAAPGTLYRATLNGEIGTALTATLSHTMYADNSLAVSGGKSAQTLLSASVAADIAGLPLNLRLQASRDAYPLNVNSYSGLFGFAANILGMRVSLDARGFAGSLQTGETQANGSLVAAVSYAIQGINGMMNFMDGTTISAGTTYQFASHQLTDIRGEISRTLWSGSRLRYIFFRDMTSGYTSSALQLSIDASFMRAGASATLDPEQPSYSANIQGSIVYDRNYGKVFFTNTPPSGGAASIRLYLDKNGNGVFDGKDEVLKNVSVAFKQSVITTRDDDGIIRVKDLTPYAEYEVSIDEASLDNPLLVPTSPGYIFIADPSAYKPVDIPLFMAGAVSGSVTRDDEKKTPVPGLTVTFRKRDGTVEKTATTFGDGAFYLMGLPPGSYTATLDTAQLGLLKVTASPEKRFFTVRVTSDGDSIENVDFTLSALPSQIPLNKPKKEKTATPKTNTNKPTQKPNK
ncbi:MAG: carboxypeptidase regulatory-like domain-containing protein [Candidatus Kapaibacteriota bacterium]